MSFYGRRRRVAVDLARLPQTVDGFCVSGLAAEGLGTAPTGRYAVSARFAGRGTSTLYRDLRRGQGRHTVLHSGQGRYAEGFKQGAPTAKSDLVGETRRRTRPVRTTAWSEGTAVAYKLRRWVHFRG